VKSLRRYFGEDFMVDDSVWTGKAPSRPFGLAASILQQLPRDSS
jgi:hypothetical protein